MAFFASVSFNGFFRSIAEKNNFLIDIPDKSRKFHFRATPLTGGLGIFFGILISAILIGGLTEANYSLDPSNKGFFENSQFNERPISKNFKVAIVFGPEKSGLDNEDLSLCDYTIKINSNQKFSSLNLSHAVTIVCYNLYTLLLKKGESNKEKLIENVAKKNELLSFYKILEETLDTSNFFNVKERKKIKFKKIKNIFCKYKMSSEEVRTLISIFKKIK